MPDRLTIRTSGLRELGKAIGDLSNDVQRRIAQAATAAAATIVEKQAKVNARAVAYKTGNLTRNIVSRRVRRPEGRLTSQHIVTVRGASELTDKQIAAGLTGAFYASMIEFGTIKRPATPYLGPAFEATKVQQVDAMKARIKQRLDKVRSTPGK